MTADGYTLLLRTDSTMEAMVVCGLLDGAGIPYLVPDSGFTDAWTALDQLADDFAREIHVPSDRLEEARGLLEQARDESEEP